MSRKTVFLIVLISWDMERIRNNFKLIILTKLYENVWKNFIERLFASWQFYPIKNKFILLKVLEYVLTIKTISKLTEFVS